MTTPSAPTPNAPAGELTAEEALFARILDLRHWTSNTAGADKRHDCKCEDCKAIKQVVHLARQAVATSQSKRARQLAELESALLAARREVEAARVALNGIADHGWCYDGRVTFTINCVGMGDAKRLEALLFAASPARSDND